jgi:hypothetical protein
MRAGAGLAAQGAEEKLLFIIVIYYELVLTFPQDTMQLR